MTHHIEVFYIGGGTGWGYAEFDDECYQVSDARYAHRKSDAIADAKDDFPDKDVYVYGRDGILQRIIK